MDDIDIYLAVELLDRSESISIFTEKYLKGFEAAADYFEYPQYGNITEFETDNCREMLLFIMQKSDRIFRFYFKNGANQETPIAMMFFNNDGSLFLGVGVYAEYEAKYEEKLRNDFKSNLVMVCYNVAPPNSITDFKSLI